jgi:hypothetical protein
VKPTILDTSTLITLALAQRESDIRRRDTHAFVEAYGGLDEAINAFVLHDNLIFDGPSLRRNFDRLPELMDYQSFGRTLWDDDLTLEQRIYESLLQTHLPSMQAPESALDFFRMHTEDWMAAEIGTVRYFPSARWRDIQRELTPEGQKLAEGLQALFGAQTPYSGAACAILLRTLYYDRLQQLASANLILHPLKGQFMGKIRADGSFHDEQSQNESWDSSMNILSVFDQSARKAFYERKQRWLGREDLSYDVPMLTSYVLNKCPTWKDLPKVLLDVRESKQAREFRGAVNQLLDASEIHENRQVDEVLLALSSAADRWSRDLREPAKTKKISVSVPLIGLGADLDVPDIKLGKSTGDRLLVFIHMVLAGS